MRITLYRTKGAAKRRTFPVSAARILTPVLMLTFILVFAKTQTELSSRNAAVAATGEKTAVHVTYVVDAGHGGIDGGAVGVDGVLEKDINLTIASRLNDLLRLCGEHTVMTRETDRSLGDEAGGSVRERKNADIRGRYNMVTATENPVFISIHLNKFEQSQYYGAQTFYSKNNPGSKLLAEAIQQSLKRILDPKNERAVKSLGREVYLMQKLTCPAVIIECGFLSNPREARLLAEPEYQLRIALAALGGIGSYAAGHDTKG